MASQALGTTPRPSFLDRVGIWTFRVVNKFVPWHKLPGIVGTLQLYLFRVELREQNLFDGYASTSEQGNAGDFPLPDKRFLHARHSDGTYNSLEMPLMGCAGIRFGRNFSRTATQKPSEQDLWTPSPRVVSERFMKRDKFIPATSLNLLAAAWIQFQIHDWFNHELSEESFDVPLEYGDAWPGGKMRLPQTKTDKILAPSDSECPGYRNINTGWWDGSQIYGSSEALTRQLRDHNSDGKLELDDKGTVAFLPRDEDGNPITGFRDNWWVALEMLHTLFTLEHNSICDELRKAYPSWTGDQIFDKARLVNCALMAKIHTVEWTPAILAHPALKIAMNANWWGLAGETLNKLVGRISKTSEAVSGIPGSGAAQDGVPYSLTEEFVSVYRMHSLVPDDIAFFTADTGKHHSTVPTVDLTFSKAQDPFVGPKALSFADAFYSFGINYPGAITNHNYPDFLRNLTTPDGIPPRDLGTVDILRDRERGVPRYNQFRRLLRLPAPKTFEELVGGVEGKDQAAKDRAALARDLKEVYNGDIEAVDALVGSHSEPLPEGFGFSDTAFRIFILMASRRLKSDRFIATQWNEETYTPEGFKWVQNSTMRDVLVRNLPELEHVVPPPGNNVFAPWQKLPASKSYTGKETNATVP
ncbi:hypothetical protein DHEL01_v207953 [Diaporthe helianthi]|uniref:Heme peroxidase n=1 Tax=Diaporthe helianthi TaxID=158607 RepID=A0A2P5HTV9_DIAHE|nr:hypothetical protein DHEL01_v207953 [Diaporthe helianthi]